MRNNGAASNVGKGRDHKSGESQEEVPFKESVISKTCPSKQDGWEGHMYGREVLSGQDTVESVGLEA